MSFKGDIDCDKEVCPVCGSDKVSCLKTYEATDEINIKTGKVIKRDKKYKNGNCIFWIYKCRTCDWISKTFSE